MSLKRQEDRRHYARESPSYLTYALYSGYLAFGRCSLRKIESTSLKQANRHHYARESPCGLGISVHLSRRKKVTAI